ncbi:hypothetical protein D3C81_1177030 [compost metagenome]
MPCKWCTGCRVPNCRSLPLRARSCCYHWCLRACPSSTCRQWSRLGWQWLRLWRAVASDQRSRFRVQALCLKWPARRLKRPMPHRFRPNRNPCRHRALRCSCCEPAVACCWLSWPLVNRSRVATLLICCSKTCCAPPACPTARRSLVSRCAGRCWCAAISTRGRRPPPISCRALFRPDLKKHLVSAYG